MNEFGQRIGGCSCILNRKKTNKWLCPAHGEMTQARIYEQENAFAQECKDAMDKSKPPVPKAEESVEELSREFHAIYQSEAKRQSDLGIDKVRHPDNYDDLPERTKEYDRVLARHVLKLLKAEREAREKAEKVGYDKGYHSGYVTMRSKALNKLHPYHKRKIKELESKLEASKKKSEAYEKELRQQIYQGTLEQKTFCGKTLKYWFDLESKLAVYREALEKIIETEIMPTAVHAMDASYMIAKEALKPGDKHD